MASSITYPEDCVAWFIRGNSLAVVSDKSSTGVSRTLRKAFQAVDHSVTNGLLIHYSSDPRKVTSISDTPFNSLDFRASPLYDLPYSSHCYLYLFRL